MSEKEMTAPVVSVGADTEQSSQNLIDNSLTDFDPDFKGFDEMQREILRMMDPSYLKTVSMSELLDNVYQSKPPLVDGLLYRGTYLFVGAPKLGKSFLMTQLAYHISTGTPLWNYPVHKGTVLYLALEDDYRRLQERSYRMFGTAENESLFFSVSAGQLGSGLDEQLTNFLREHPGTSLIIIDTLQLPRKGFLIAEKVQPLIRLISSGYIKTSGITGTFFFGEQKRSIRRTQQSVGAGDHIKLIV